MNRLFVALDLPRYAKDSLAVMQQGLPDARWVDADMLHLTLAFLGEVDRPTFIDAMHGLARVETRPFDLELQGLGFFPNRGAVRQLWAGVRPEPELERLQRRVVRALADIDVVVEKRRFVPHVTLARFRVPPPEPRLQAFLQRHSLFRLPPFPVSDFHLYSSWLGAGAAHYEIEASYELVPGLEPDAAARR
ncbi:MAG: RNA 2',3'-cyclic phosphodiesterase [Geminicoccaceae bacterium]|nr:MAG: RNA 2',3'-cyclic phosphodiesterase [Geminicoccaceae bacterium]